jgi:hypothetical protein
MKQLLAETDYWFQEPNAIEFLHMSEWYDPENKDMFVYFDSWADLSEIIRNVNFREKSQKLIKFMVKRESRLTENWKVVMYKV